MKFFTVLYLIFFVTMAESKTKGFHDFSIETIEGGNLELSDFPILSDILFSMNILYVNQSKVYILL